MNHINNTDGRAASRARLTNCLVNKEGKWLLPSGRGVQRKISRRVKPLVSWVATCALLFSPCLPAHGGLLKADVDFSNYDVPLYEQIYAWRAVLDEKHQTKIPKKEAMIVASDRSRGKRWPHGFEELGALTTSQKTKRFLAAI